ncbi:Nn.00g112990.m01.CDS01 [Neocucurbitaria sp. VM-36]
MAQPPMTSFWPIFAGKSDGQDVVNLKGRVLRNGPTQEQLDDKPNEQGQCDYYRLIKKDDPKHLDWRKKLGGMLLREIGGKAHEDKWQQCILWELPENYVLYEHIKTKADGQVKTVKNHSGGGHDRQDAYLYGYPKGPKKRFRSPIEFFPHLLWLCTDETNDYATCTCKMCCPQQPEPEKPAVKAEVKPELSAAIKREPTPNAPAQANIVVGRNPTVQIPVQKPPQGPLAKSPSAKPATPVPASNPTANAPQIRVPPTLHSAPLPQPRSLEQQADLSYNKFLCRTGEVVWFFRPKTSAWGLGLVVRRWAAKDNPADRSYLIQPLSHPFETPPQELVTTDQHIKPWLAWSAPNCTFPYLQQNPQLSYGQIDWRALESGQFGEGIASVDASIMAAKAIDSTYTLFERLKTATEAGIELRHYNGMFLGAEKIWRGEAVRLHIGMGSELMVISDIIERVFSNVPQKQPNAQPVSQVIVVGDVYSYATLPAPDAANPPKPPQENSNIPTRMVHDMAWRNRMLVPMTRTFAYWKLMGSSHKLEISDVKGRWYETSLVFQEPFAKAVKNNEGGNGIWMNSRGDATGLGKNAGAPRPDRAAAFGASIPKGTQLIHGLDPPNQPPVEQQQQQQQQPHDHDMQNMDMGIGADSATFSLDDFMNVDHLGEDAGMDFPF